MLTQSALFSAKAWAADEPRFRQTSRVGGSAVTEQTADAVKPARPDGQLVWRPALCAELLLRFDEDRYGFVLDEHLFRFWFPLGDRMPAESRAVPITDADLLTRPPAGGRFAPVPAWCDEPRELRALEKQVSDEVYRSESRPSFVHKGLKLHAQVGESREDFAARCVAAAREAADDQIAKLQDRFATKARRMEAKIEKLEDRIVAQEGVVQARKTEEMVGIGETVLSFFVGRRRSVGTAVRRRGTTNRAAQKLDGLENDLARAQDEANALAEELEQTIAERIEEAEDDARAGIEATDVGLERSDIRVARFGVVWVPVGRRL